MQKARLAVIGAGSMGTRHAELVRAHDACQLAGICDPDLSRCSVAKALGVPFYEDIDALLQRERPSGAIIATPNAQHAAAAEACARHSVHVLVEKPIADTLDRAQRIIRAAGHYGVSVLVGHHRRHSPLAMKTRELVQGGTLGKLVGVSVLWAILKPEDYFRDAWRRERPGGGPLLINLIHELDSLRFICGEVREVYAHISSAARGFQVEDSLSISLTFENGALGTVLASDATPALWSYEATTGENPLYFHADETCYHFLGTAASLAFPRMELWQYAKGVPKGWQHPLERQVIEVPATSPLKNQLEHFCRIVRGEESPLVSAEEGARSLALALAVRESAERHKPIDPLSLLPEESS